jgi:hypothetical protein
MGNGEWGMVHDGDWTIESRDGWMMDLTQVDYYRRELVMINAGTCKASLFSKALKMLTGIPFLQLFPSVYFHSFIALTIV